MEIRQTLFGNLNFEKISSSKDFNEADVRAEIIEPILKELGFSRESILREKHLISPFLKTGSKKRPVNLIPDYVMKVENGFAWVLDAKSPNQKIVNNDNVEQVYSYAAHPEIRSNYFALCNGLEFACFRTTETEKPVLYFRVGEIDQYWQTLQNTLSPDSFQSGKKFTYDKSLLKETKEEFDYHNRPLLNEISVMKQQARRHFGVHGYFTRQTWNVVSTYIKNFSQPSDIILDPYGGSGVTAIEALVNNRKTINIDINPMAVFIVKSLLAPVNFSQLSESFQKMKKEYLVKKPKSKKEVNNILTEYPGPLNLKLPKGSDVQTVAELFSKKLASVLLLITIPA